MSQLCISNCLCDRAWIFISISYIFMTFLQRWLLVRRRRFQPSFQCLFANIWTACIDVTSTSSAEQWPTLACFLCCFCSLCEPAIQRILASSLTFRIRRVCCYSNKTRAPIANPLNTAQLGAPPTIPLCYIRVRAVV